MALSRRDWLSALAVPAFCSGLALAAQKRPLPLNFVFVLIDDWGWRDAGCYASTFYETPNIDRLASQGMRFTSAYTAGPVCSPTRASILTGKYPARLHLTDWLPGRPQWPTSKLLVPAIEQQLPLAEVTIAERLKPLGYATASIGKWHLGGPDFYPDKQGFDINIGGTARGSPESYFSPFHLPGLESGPPGEYLTDRLTKEATAFIERNQHTPFFLDLPQFAVHLPLQAKQELIRKYEAKPKNPSGQRDPIYAAMIESVDQGVGVLLGKLDELGIADRTVVILMSDNGGLRFEGKRTEPVTSNAPLRAGKGHLYEGGIRVPLIVRWPGSIRAGSVGDHPVSSIDFLPTMLAMAGLSPGRETIDGLDLSSLWEHRHAPKRDALYWHYPHYSNQAGVPAGAIRQGAYKLIEFFEDGRLELYDLGRDIGERNNLASQKPRIASELQRKLAMWRTGVGAQMCKTNPNYDPAKADQGLAGAREATS